MQLASRQLEWFWREVASAARRPETLEVSLRAIALRRRFRMRAAAKRMADAVAQGRTLAEAVQQEGDLFPTGAAVALESAERNRCLPEVLHALADAAQAEDVARYNMAGTISWPIVIALVIGGILFAISSVVLPMVEEQFTRMFNEMDVYLPSMTVAVQYLPFVIQYESGMFLLLPAALLGALYVLPREWTPFPRLFDWLRLRIPGMGRVLRRRELSRWCGALAYLIRAGVPEAESLRLAGAAARNAPLHRASSLIALAVEKGTPLPEAIEEREVLDGKDLFPPTLAWMLNEAAKSGGHSGVWPIARDLYRDQTGGAGRAASLILRAIIIFLALQMIGLVGVMALGNFLPLIKLMNSLGG